MKPQPLTLATIARAAAWALIWILVAGSAGSAPAAAEPSQKVSQDQVAEAAAPDAAPADAEPDAAEPDAAAAADAEGWLIDEPSGLRYRIEKVPKIEGTYQWLDETHVQLPAGAQLEVVKDDDEWFWVKFFEPKFVRREIKEKGPSPEELAAVAATYQFELPTGDRLRFEEFDHGLPRSGQWRNGFDVADMDGDGHFDIVFGPSRKGRPLPNVFVGDGHGNWDRWHVIEYPELPYDYGDVEAADFNGDGLVDLAFGFHLRGMAVIVRDDSPRGDGPRADAAPDVAARFVPWSDGIGLHYPGEPGPINAFSSRALGAADWNGDGKLDVVAMGEGPKGPTGAQGRPQEVVETSRGFLVYLNHGDGAWTAWRPQQDAGVLRPNFGDDFVLADLNGDGQLDLLSVSRQMSNNQILNLGIGGGKVSIVDLVEARPNALVTGVAVAEIDGAPGLDLVLGYVSRELGVWRTGIDVLYGAPDMTWKRRTLFSEESRRGISALAAGELDGDGHPDLVATTDTGEVWIFLGDGEGFFVREEEQLTEEAKGCRGFTPRLVDLDGDGRDEVIVGFAGEPAGLPGIPGLSHPGCQDGGSLRAWTPRPATAP